MNRKILISIFIILIIGLLIFYFLPKKEENLLSVNSFEDCIMANLLVLESYPRQCRTSDGKVFVEDIGNELEKINLIRINAPRPNQEIESPLVINGEARGYWFFEASFPIFLFDENNNQLGVAVAQATTDWMTEEFVPFEATLEFTSQPLTKKGYLVLKKDNPSGLPENDDELKIPINFIEN